MRGWWPAGLALVGCASPCEDYVREVERCYARAGDERELPAIVEDCPEDRSEETDLLYTCLADAYAEGDCGSDTGLVALSDALTACP